MKPTTKYICMFYCIILFFTGCVESGRPPYTELGKEEALPTKELGKEEESLPTRTIYSTSPDDVWKLFDEVGYTREAWMAGIREVPRIYLTNIPMRWKENSNAMSVEMKKRLFFRLLGPAVLRANELIEIERKKLMSLREKYPELTKPEKRSLVALARKYKVVKEDTADVIKDQLEELMLRVRPIPVSLALAQGAEESGWGTSRFSLLGNSLFGQWDFSGKGMTPERQRKELGNYGLARFDTPQDAVNAYMLNLNTHNAYAKMREVRARMADNRKPVTGYELAKTLDRYSERGNAYVDGLHSIMRINNLVFTDEAHLGDKEVIYITPKE